MRFIHETIGTDALVEEYIEGRELYVGHPGQRAAGGAADLGAVFDGMPEESRRIATERLKWSLTYQKKHGIVSGPARELPDKVAARIRETCKRVYRNLMLSGYARIDLRLREDGEAVRDRGEPQPAARRRRGLRRLGEGRRHRVPGARPAHRGAGPALRAVPSRLAPQARFLTS